MIGFPIPTGNGNCRSTHRTPTYFFPPLYGEGYGLMNNLLNGNTAEALSGMGSRIDMSNVWVVLAILFVIAVFKAIAMTTTFAAGGVGGVFIPTLFIWEVLGISLPRSSIKLDLVFQNQILRLLE